MAELRTIEKSLEIGLLSVTGTILSLPDEYVIIPHLLYNSRKFEDFVITVIGPNGIFLLSYQIFLKEVKSQSMIEDCIIYLREYAMKLEEFFYIRNVELLIEPSLIIVVDSNYPEIGGNADDILLVPSTALKKVITSKKTDRPLSFAKIKEMTFAIRASGNLKRINQYQLLMEMEYQESIITYLAYDTIQDRSVLIKEIRNYTDPNEIEDFEKNEIIREAKLTMQLEHKNIMSIEQIIPRENSLFIVSEWIDRAQSLRDIIMNHAQGLDPVIVKGIIIQICDALEHAHSHGVIHRNIRPENIIMTEDFQIKLTNFDLAKKLDMSTLANIDLKKMLKENPYAAPELKLSSEGHHNIDQRVDIYSTGIILFELLTNRLPEHFDESDWVSPARYNKAVSPDLDKIVFKSVRFDPHQRFATISALKNKLQKLGGPKDENCPENRYTKRQIYKRTKNSIIFRAEDSKLSRQVALKKVLMDTFLTTEQRRQKLDKFLAEAFIVSKLIHPSIVSVYDYFIEDGDCFIVMEWLEGRTLRELQNDIDEFPLEVVIDIVMQIGEAINYAHRQNIMHKDIKPENIIFNNGKITILDFGLASFFEESDNFGAYGTVMYTAPEQLENDWILDQRVDIFSLGVLLYELLTGRYPYDPGIIMNKYKGCDLLKPVPPSEINFNCPRNIDYCIQKALEIDPDNRYHKLEEMLHDLKSSYYGEDNKEENANKIIAYLPELAVFFIVSLILIAFIMVIF